MFSKLIKKGIIAYSKELIQQRIDVAEKAMNASQEAANLEEKSTAGDKYDTSRAMNQRERDMNAKQLMEAKSLMQLFNSISYDDSLETIQAGSFVKTDSGVYLIAVGLGKVNFMKNDYMIISSIAPIAQLLIDKKVGDEIVFQGKTNRILEIC